MSMNHRFYVGPYLHVKTTSLNFFQVLGDDEVHDNYCNLEGEEYAGEADLFIGPNRNSFCGRVMSFGKFQENVGVQITPEKITAEIEMLEAYATMQLDTLKEAGIEFSVEWGVVTGVF